MGSSTRALNAAPPATSRRVSGPTRPRRWTACCAASWSPPAAGPGRSPTRAFCHLTLGVWRAESRKCGSRGNSTVYPVPQRRPDAGAFACLACNRDVTAGSGKRCGGEAYIRSPRVMPTPMPIGSRSQSVAVGPMGRSVFRRRSQTGSVRLRTLSGNAVGGENPPRGFESLSLRICL
jgi:hypothetical protein